MVERFSASDVCSDQCCSQDRFRDLTLSETIRFKSSLTSIIIECTYLTLNMNKIWGCFKVQVHVRWKNAFYGETGSRKGLGKTLTIKNTFLTFTLSVNKIIIYQFSMFKSLDSIASVVGIFMYLTISKFKQVLRSRKGLDYNTGSDGRVVRMWVQIMVLVYGVPWLSGLVQQTLCSDGRVIRMWVRILARIMMLMSLSETLTCRDVDDGIKWNLMKYFYGAIISVKFSFIGKQKFTLELISPHLNIPNTEFSILIFQHMHSE